VIEEKQDLKAILDLMDLKVTEVSKVLQDLKDLKERLQYPVQEHVKVIKDQWDRRVHPVLRKHVPVKLGYGTRACQSLHHSAQEVTSVHQRHFRLMSL
jgi:hypothetical protein